MTRIAIALGAALLMATYASAGMGKEAHPLKAAAGSKAEVHINEGIAHYEKGHWDVATKHFIEAEKAGDVTRWLREGGNGAGVVDLETLPGAPRAELGAGSVHHIAFAVPDRAAQLEVRKALADTGYQVTPVIDRDYFWSIYFRTPGGVLFEVATSEPGFDRDEDPGHLGEELKLPKQHAHLRERLWLDPLADLQAAGSASHGPAT